MKVSIIGNSFSVAPRDAPGVRPYPDLIASRAPGWEVCQRSVDGAPIAVLEQAVAATLAQDVPDALVVQTGIVDCAPRPLGPFGRGVLTRIRPPVLQRRVIQWVHDHRATIIRRRRLIQVTPLPAFRETAERILRACGDRAVAVLPILPAPMAVHRRNPLLAREIDAYNDVLRRLSTRARFFEVAELISAREVDALAAGPESVHLNQEGHTLIADRLGEWLRAAQVQSLRA